MKGNISITRNSKNIISIKIRDMNSCVEFCEVHLSPEQFALAVTGLSCQGCNFSICGIEHVGKVCETKVELIKVKDSDILREKEGFEDKIRELVNPYEVDGWTVASNIKSLTAKAIQGGKCKVVFERYI